MVDATPSLRHDNSSSADFPDAARRWGFEGLVTTEFDVEADGHTAAQRAIISYPPFVFDDAATGIVKRARYDQSYRPEGSLGCGGKQAKVRFTLE